MLTRFEEFSNAISGIYRCIQKIERMEMAKYGLKGPHAQCLVAMARFPGGVTASQLCELCEKDKAAISRTVAELAQAGLIHRPEGAQKRYRVPLRLTEQGLAAARAVMGRAELAVSQATGGYGGEQREIFISTLGMIAGNLQVICRDGLKEEQEEME